MCTDFVFLIFFSELQFILKHLHLSYVFVFLLYYSLDLDSYQQSSPFDYYCIIIIFIIVIIIIVVVVVVVVVVIIFIIMMMIIIINF